MTGYAVGALLADVAEAKLAPYAVWTDDIEPMAAAAFINHAGHFRAAFPDIPERSTGQHGLAE